MHSARSPLPTFALLAGLVVAGCDVSPTAPPEDGLETPGPSLLIGNSPLIVLDRSVPAVEVTVEVSRGLTNVKVEDTFRVRVHAAWWDIDVDALSPFGMVDVELAGVKDTGVRQGNTVAILICINIPAPVREELLAADAGGMNPTLHVLSELILVDAAGREHVLDSDEEVQIVDPRGDG